jgi:hypothetical protein
MLGFAETGRQLTRFDYQQSVVANYVMQAVPVPELIGELPLVFSNMRLQQHCYNWFEAHQLNSSELRSR